MNSLHQRSIHWGIKDWLRRGAPRAAGFVALWAMLTDGNPSSWGVGVPAIVAATIVSVTLLPDYRWRWRFLSLARFVPFFFWQSLRGGLDVAQRALSLRLPLNPRLLDYHLRLPDGPARIFFANIVSLLPGTVSVAIEETRLVVHALDGAAPILYELRSLEEAVAALFAIDLGDSATAQGEARHA